MDFRNIMVRRVVVGALVAQAATCAFMLTLNAFNAVSEAQFMLLLCMNLISLDAVIYAYLTMRLGSSTRLGGGFMILAFLTTAIFIL